MFMKLCLFFVGFFLLVSCEKSVTVTPETAVLVKHYKGFPNNEVDTVTSILQKFTVLKQY